MDTLIREPAGSERNLWHLTPADHALVAAKSRTNRLRFAVMLLFFRDRGRFPRDAGEISAAAVTALASVLGAPMPPEPLAFDSGDRTLERQRAEIRGLFGFREATLADAAALREWLRDDMVAQFRDHDRLTAELEARCRALRIEPPTPDRVARIVRGAVRAYEDRFATAVHGRLPPEVRAKLDALLHPAPGRSADDVDEPSPPGARALLNFVCGDPGRASVDSVMRELERLETIRAIGLPADLFARVLPHEVELYRQRVAVQPPSDLRRLPDAVRITWLAAFTHLRGRALTDSLVELLVETVHAIGARAERRVELKVMNELRKVTGKSNLLFEIANASLAKPDGTVRQVVFPVGGEQTLRDLVREWQSGPMYRKSLRTTIRNSYAGHYRRMVPKLLDALDFRSNNAFHRPVIDGLALVRRYATSRQRYIPFDEVVPIDDVVRPLWRDAVVDTDAKGRTRVNRLTYEICVLEALRERLRSKEIWVVGANRYRNPDEDLPTDFAEKRTAHYAALGLPVDPEHFISGLQEEMRAALHQFDEGLPRNPHVKITARRGGWITLSPLQARSDPENVEALKAEVSATWPMTSLLDIVKEADLPRFQNRSQVVQKLG